MPKSEDHVRAVRAAGHARSGGHHGPPAKAPINQIVRRPQFHEHQRGQMTYVYHEYPKHVIVGWRTVAVNSEAEEAEAKQLGSVTNDAAERTRMLKIAEVNGLKVDGRWKLDRMADAIRNAGFDPEADPFK